MQVMVVTADQRDSRRSGDQVPKAMADLDADLGAAGLLRAFERTAGDEFQGVLDDPAAFTTVVERLLRDSGWHIGIGVGPVEQPLPQSTRAGRGMAYLRAREAVTSAKSSPGRVRVVGDDPWARWLETTLWLWAAVLTRRTPGGWAVADLVDTGSSYGETAAALGVTPGAISQRAQAAGIAESRRARELVTDLAARLLQGAP